MNYLITITLTIILTLTVLSMETQKPRTISKNEQQMIDYERDLDNKIIESSEKLYEKAVYFRSKAIELERQNQRLKKEITRLKQDKITKEFHL